MIKLKRSGLIILVVIIAAAVGVIVWQVSSHVPVSPGDKQLDSDANKPADANDGADDAEPNEPGDPNKPGDPNAPAEPNKPAEPNAPAEPNKPAEPNDPMENISLNDFEMKNVIAKLAEWTGKVIIPTGDSMSKKITIYSHGKVPRSRALTLIFSALRTQGIVAERTDDTIYLKPLDKAKTLSVPTIPPEVPLASLQNKNQVVQKFFQLRSYNAGKMAEIIVPLVGEYGYVSADDTTGKVLVIDTVENLMRVQSVIDQFDVPEAEQAVTETFKIHDGDPAEIVQVLRLLMGEGGVGSRTSSGSSRDRNRGSSSDRNRNRSSSSDRNRNQGKSGGSATSVAVGPSGGPVILIPEPRRKWIIAKASPEDMEQIRKWIEQLDTRETIAPEYETIGITYANVQEVADKLNEMLQEMPGSELKTSVLIQPLEQARQIVVYGREDVRKIVKKLVEEIDVPAGAYEEKTFKLKYSDPEEIKKNIDDLYTEQAPTDWYGRYQFYRSKYGQKNPADMVKVIAFPTMQQVTVISSPENMRKIEKQIEEWDVPIDTSKVKPLIISLKNTDPVQMADLLSKLFSDEDRNNWYDYYFGSSKTNVVGPLYGQLTFEEVPGTKKLIVISKIPEAYKVIKELVRELDTFEMAEVPKVVTLKYADAEDLSIRLNAIFNEPGTAAPLWLSETGLSAYSMDEAAGSSDTGSSGSSSGSSENSGATKTEYKTWWGGARRRVDEMPISNVIGRIRFVPDPHSKSIMVLCPPEFMDSIVSMIQDLDVPGKQVRIKAVIMEIDHSNLTSLGVKLASNSLALGQLNENAITALSELEVLQERGSATFTLASQATALIDFLVKKVHAKVLNQQTLWTKDNEEADFFKGRIVGFYSSLSVSDTGGRATSGIDYKNVGMVLRVRPNITPEKKVDMTINLMVSQLTGEMVNDNPVRRQMNTQTKMIVKDGETIMLGGMLDQEESITERKVPFFGDIPLIGGLFRHYEKSLGNTEMLVFITPYVIDEDPNSILPKAKAELKVERDKLNEMLNNLRQTMNEAE